MIILGITKKKLTRGGKAFGLHDETKGEGSLDGQQERGFPVVHHPKPTLPMRLLLTCLCHFSWQ